MLAQLGSHQGGFVEGSRDEALDAKGRSKAKWILAAESEREERFRADLLRAVAHLHEGDVFGERAQLQSDIKRLGVNKNFAGELSGELAQVRRKLPARTRIGCKRADARGAEVLYHAADRCTAVYAWLHKHTQ